MHANEIRLVQRTPSGNLIATAQLTRMARVADTLGPAYKDALGQQISRQTVLLKAE